MKKKIVLRISICPTAMERDGDKLDELAVLSKIVAVAGERWPRCEVRFDTLQIGHRQGDSFAECSIDGVRDDSLAEQVLDDIEWSDETLYEGVNDER